MKYRNTQLLAGTDLTGSGTKIIDINLIDPISRITLLWKVTKSKHGMDSYAHKDISKIELVDGSDVLFSMDGGQCQALNIYDRKCSTMNHGYIYSGNSQVSTYAIDFGRFLFDTELAFDPKRFRNPQLKFTWDEDVSDTGVTVNELSVYADVFDEKIVSPMGFLMSKNHWGTTMPADGTYEYVDLPRDYPLRKMLIQGYYAAYEPWYVIEDARLDEDNQKRIVFDWVMEDYYRIMKTIWTPVIERISGGAVTTGQTFYVTPTDYAQCVVGMLGAGYDLYISGWQRGGSVTIYSETVDTSFSALLYGFLPNHCFEFPMGDPMDPDDWYNLQEKGSVQLRLESGSAGTNGSGAVILQQLRRY